MIYIYVHVFMYVWLHKKIFTKIESGIYLVFWLKLSINSSVKYSKISDKITLVGRDNFLLFMSCDTVHCIVVNSWEGVQLFSVYTWEIVNVQVC